jgi:hypothetical protein
MRLCAPGQELDEILNSYECLADVMPAHTTGAPVSACRAPDRA